MRRQRDFYETPPWMVDALVDHLPELSGMILCPCVGDGSLLKRLRERKPDLFPIVTNDLDETKAADHHFDATTPDLWRAVDRDLGRPDWIVENPPFNVEMEILQHAWDLAMVGVAFMARVSFTEPTSATSYQGKPCTPRGPWLKAHPYQKRITLERYSFTGNGKSDNTTTDWLIWSKKELSGPFGISAHGYKP